MVIRLQGLACREAFNQLVWELNPVIQRVLEHFYRNSLFKTTLRTSQEMPHIRTELLIWFTWSFPSIISIQSFQWEGKKQNPTEIFQKSKCLISMLLVHNYHKATRSCFCTHMVQHFVLYFLVQRCIINRWHSDLLNLATEKAPLPQPLLSLFCNTVWLFVHLRNSIFFQHPLERKKVLST